jgi:hypothetical protein
MRKSESLINRPVNRRSFLKKGMLAGSAATVGAGLIGSLKPAFGQNKSLTKGDVASCVCWLLPNSLKRTFGHSMRN